MSARIHLVVGPPGAARTGRLLTAYRAAARGGLGRALYLVPTRRHAEQVRERFLTPDTPALVAPHVYDLQAFADEVVRRHDPAARPLADADRRLLVDAVVGELVEAKELPYFAAVADTRGFAAAAAGTVAELTDAAADLRVLLKASGGRKPPDADRHLQALRIFDRYRRRLAKLHRLDPADRLGRAAVLWGVDSRGPFSTVRTVIVDGLSTLTPYSRTLLDTLRDAADEFWLGLTDGAEAVRAWATAPVGEPGLFNPPPEVVTERVEEDADRPAGLRRVDEWLFREAPPQQPGEVVQTPPPDPFPDTGRGGRREAAGFAPPPRVGEGVGGWGLGCDGLHLIQAPGELGEARLVARHVRGLMAAGISADRVLVVARRLDAPTADLFREVFAEYAVPADVEGADPLARVPAVAFLLKAWRLAADGWPFARVAAVLRHSYFRPDWPEVSADPEVPAAAEALLRLVGETRGKDEYLAAVRAWEHTPPEALEDEQAEEGKRRRTHRLAGRCRPFLERFFKAWDRLAGVGPAGPTVARLKAFADDLGVSRAGDAADADGLARLWAGLDRWAAGERKAVRQDKLAGVLAAVTGASGLGRTGRDADRVRVMSADAARGLDADYTILIGLGEGSWPRLGGPISLLDDAERERLRRAGVGLPDPAGRPAGDRELFRDLLSAPRRGVVFSYPAVDDRGQPRLPCSFLRDVLALFPAGGIPTTSRRMPVEGYFTDEPMSAAEARVQWAAVRANPERERGGDQTPSLALGVRPEQAPPLALDLLSHLARAREVADARFRVRGFTPYDGHLFHPAAVAELARRFGPDRVFSPTALEAYVACPFKFLLGHVLRLDPLDDPAEEVEHTRRGAAFHRALARLHRQVKELLPAGLADGDIPAGVTDELLGRIDEAVEEYARRAPSRAGKELWRLEGERLKRSAAKYARHWAGFREPWRKAGAAPVPHAFEADFGVTGENAAEALVIRVGDVEVRLGGRIDRIDAAELADGGVGFWVIDYKTGRAENYVASQVERFEKLQLPLYALATARVLFAGRPARPLGLGYWLVTDSGHKGMLPARKTAALSWLADPGRWERFREQLEGWVAVLVGRIRGGHFPLAPRSEHCTDTCRFGPVCRIAPSRNVGKGGPLALPVVPKDGG